MHRKFGTLVLFLLKYPRTRGKVNERVIGDLEKFLIEVAFVRNPDLKNKVGRKTPGFEIQGVHRSGPGKRSEPAAELRRALGL